MITRADASAPLNAMQMARLARELHDVAEPVILVHGTGHVGKPFAIKYDYVREGRLAADRAVLANEIRVALRQLNAMVIEALRDAGLAARRVPASEVFSADSGRIRDVGATELLGEMLANEEVPVFHGDLVRLPCGDFKVLSSDTITSSLAAALKPNCVAYLSDVDGVHGCTSHKGMASAPLQRITAAMLDKVFQSERDLQDVSGGMRGKLVAAMEAARHSRRCVIANGLRAGVLSAVLRDKPVSCTEVIADPAAC